MWPALGPSVFGNLNARLHPKGYAVIKDLTTVEAMKMAKEEGYARDGMSRYSRGWDVDYSYARGRDSRGRYTGYSGHDKEEMIDHLQDMMRSARTEEERENYRKTIDQLSR